MKTEKLKAYLELLNARISLAMVYQHNGSPDYCKELKQELYEKNDEAELKIRSLNEHKSAKQKTRR